MFVLSKIDKQTFYRFIRASTKYGLSQPRRGGIELRPYQVELGWKIIESVIERKAEEIFALQSRQSGKTETIACVSYFLAVLPSIYKAFIDRDQKIRIGIFGPKKEQADIAFERVKERVYGTGFMRDFFGIEVLSDNQRTLRLSNGSIIRSSTASYQSNIEGFTFDLVIVEKAQDGDETRLTKSIFPMTSATGGTRVLLGTPTFEGSGYFYEQVTKHPNKVFVVDWREAGKYSSHYRSFVKKEMRRLGVGSDAFRSQYELEWIVGDRAILTPEQLYRMRDGSRSYREFNKRCYVGIDVAKHRASTVVTVISDEQKNLFRILNWLELRGLPYETQATQIRNFLSNYRVERGYIDVFGPGEAFFEMLKLDYLRPLKPERYRLNELWRNLLYALGQNYMRYPADECDERFEFERQMLRLQRQIRGGYLQCKAPRGIRESDDYCHSLAYAYYAIERDRGKYCEVSCIEDVTIERNFNNRTRMKGEVWSV